MRWRAWAWAWCRGAAVFGSLSVEENLLATARSAPGDKAWTLERVMTLFERLRERRRQSARTLSGASSRCWPSAAPRPTLLLVLDEATEAWRPHPPGNLALPARPQKRG
jgi:branched-chain amino acid transport system ATP-binding protein